MVAYFWGHRVDHVYFANKQTFLAAG